MGAKLDEDGLISDGVDKFKQHPEDYLAIMYQKVMVTWPADQQKYTIIARPGTIGFRPTGCSAEGWMVCMTAKYQCLPPLAEFRSADRDTFTCRRLRSSAALIVTLSQIASSTMAKNFTTMPIRQSCPGVGWVWATFRG